MDKRILEKLLKDLREKKKTVPAVLEKLKSLPYEDLDFAKVDQHRSLRQGFSEVVFCEGKTLSQIKAIVKKLAKKNSTVLASRASAQVYRSLKNSKSFKMLSYNALACMLLIGRPAPQIGRGTIAIVSAGTADIPVAEEAAFTAAAMGNQVSRIYDVGVAGLHRLFSKIKELRAAQVLVVVAGMEGALPSVVAGLVARPVIAVPTSVGYGANFKGLTALLGMMNSCSPHVAVVNIDNGFGAGYMAALINKKD